MADNVSQHQKDKRLGIGFAIGSVTVLLAVLSCFAFMEPADNPVLIAVSAASDTFDNAVATVSLSWQQLVAKVQSSFSG